MPEYAMICQNIKNREIRYKPHKIRILQDIVKDLEMVLKIYPTIPDYEINKGMKRLI